MVEQKLLVANCHFVRDGHDIEYELKSMFRNTTLDVYLLTMENVLDRDPAPVLRDLFGSGSADPVRTHEAIRLNSNNSIPVCNLFVGIKQNVICETSGNNERKHYDLGGEGFNYARSQKVPAIILAEYDLGTIFNFVKG